MHNQTFPKAFTVIIISLLGIIVYSNTFFCSFHFDDLPSIINNPSIRDIRNLVDIWSFLPRRFILYLSIALNYHFNGLNVFGYHLFNLLVHLASACFLSWLVLLTFSTPGMKGAFAGDVKGNIANVISLFAGLVFVTHPIQTQAVTYIVQRDASMAALFYLVSLSLYVKFRLCPEKIYYVGSLISAIAAMFTKETAITLPLMILLYEVSFLETKGSINWKSLAPFLMTIFIIPLTMFMTETGASRLQQLRSEPGISSMHYLLTQFRVMGTYVRLVFFPVNQNIDYDYPVFKNIFELPVLCGFLFLTAILYSAKRLFPKYRLVSFSIFWFFLTLLPESSFLPIKDVIYEHRLYLPMAGFSMFLVSSVYYILGRHNFRAMAITLTMIIACYSVLTYQRNEVWKDEFTLWGDTVQKSPHKARGYINLALAYSREGNIAQAIFDYNMAIKADPKYADAYYNRGLEYYRQGRLSQAFFDFNKVIEINPGNADAYNNRGLVYYGQNNYLQAISDYDKALGINPNYIAVYNNRAVAYYWLKQYGKAWYNVHKAQESGFNVNPGFISALKQASGSAL